MNEYTSNVVTGGVLLALGVIAYLLPAVIAVKRGHRNAGPVILIDLLLGWTVIGWIVALVWSCTDNVQRRAG
jgi:hypothetical protein